MGSVNIKRQGTMFIFSAPSGGGKSSVIRIEKTASPL